MGLKQAILFQSEMIVLHLVQGLAANVAALSQQVAKLSTPYLPEGIEKNVAASAAYATELRDTFAKVTRESCGWKTFECGPS